MTLKIQAEDARNKSKELKAKWKQRLQKVKTESDKSAIILK